MDELIDAMTKILEEANTNPKTITEAPFTQAVRCLDEMTATNQLGLAQGE